ncbi:hypothetical protein QEN19_001571 [Hanseniaspora menglaensis]
MSAVLPFTEINFNDIHITYIKHNIIIIRQNGIADNIYKVKLTDQFNPSQIQEKITSLNDIKCSDDEDGEISDPLENFEIANIINTIHSDESSISLQILCTSIIETLRFTDPEIKSLMLQLPSKLFLNVENKHDKLMEILSNINKIVI